ncbi:unnamed protein product [Ilex paraguariensis]|uniref:NB-ARC domain-containing protein n=1 Tax=Ilex paraguariensis TaxID=185542 RepID=A0ABC8R1G1_9AQUA
MLCSKVRKRFEAFKDETQHLITQFAEVERNHGSRFDDQTTETDGSLQEDTWMGSSKEVICNIEDEVDQIMTIQFSTNINTNNKLFRMLPSSGLANCRSIKKHLTAIQKLQKDLTSIANGGRKFGHHVSQTVHSPAALVTGADNNGRRDIEERLLQFLTNAETSEIVLVTGMTGVGKTFLVQRAFNQVTRRHFEPFWLSYDPSLEKKDNLANLYEKIIMKRCTYVELPIYVREHMELKKLEWHAQQKLGFSGSFRLVVDDVPEVQEAWDFLTSALPQSTGRVIFITQNIESAKAFKCDIPHTCIEIEKLKHEDAWRLFSETASQHLEYNDPWRCPESLKKVAEATVRDCHGLPLPIVTVATQLANRGMDPSVWYTLRGILMKKPLLPKATNETQTYPSDHSISNDAALMLCYNALCFPLKYILFYCCFYLRGREIPEKKLIRLCVAEGLVEDTENTSAE